MYKLNIYIWFYFFTFSCSVENQKPGVGQVLTFLLGKIDNFHLLISFIVIFNFRQCRLRNHNTLYTAAVLMKMAQTTEAEALEQKDAHVEKSVINSLIYIPTFINDFK